MALFYVFKSIIIHLAQDAVKLPPQNTIGGNLFYVWAGGPLHYNGLNLCKRKKKQLSAYLSLYHWLKSNFPFSA